MSQSGAISGPVAVTLNAAQPSVLQIANTSTSTAAAKNVWSLLTAGKPFSAASAAPTTPLTPGENIVIYCTGLGAISQTLAAGAAPPTTPIKTVNSVTVEIGGQSMPVTFAGLVPGYPGIYQVTGTVPSGVPSGNDISLSITVAGQTSTAVKVKVQ